MSNYKSILSGNGNLDGKSPKVVLTADETMMSKYRGNIFMGFTTCMPEGVIPERVYFNVFAPPVPTENNEAQQADFGLRLVEASLLENGFDEEEVAVAHPKDLKKITGEDTEIIGVSGHDILGLNPPTSEFVDILRTGRPYNRAKFLELMEMEPLQENKVVVGGKSAWQVADTEVMDKLGIDYVHLGEAEKTAPDMFQDILNGENVPRIVEGEVTPVEDIPNLHGAVIRGLVEISRGCGRGCKFCSTTKQKQRHKPIDQILQDVKTNVAEGLTEIGLHGEDVLRYGTKEIHPNKEKVLELFEKVSDIDGVEGVAPSHIALATAYHNEDLIEDISEIVFSSTDMSRLSAQTGIETGSPRLIGKYMAGKALPSDPDKWPEIVEQSIGILEDNNWVIAGTLMNGLPDETPDDVVKTLELVDDLDDTSSLIVPLNFVSMDSSSLSKEKTFTVDDMTPEHWQLFGKCLEHDAKVARKLRKAVNIGNPIAGMGLDVILGILFEASKNYAKDLKKGLPPRDYDETSDEYMVPDVLLNKEKI